MSKKQVNVKQTDVKAIATKGLSKVIAKELYTLDPIYLGEIDKLLEENVIAKVTKEDKKTNRC